MAKATAPAQATNGSAPEGATALADAIAYEESIAEEARGAWAEWREENGDSPYLTASLLNTLLPLLRRPIPAGFIKYVPKLEKGKPYESTGVSNVQVQINRMDNVLGPINWGWTEDYQNNGQLCRVTVWVGEPEGGEGPPLLQRSSYGGVDRGSTTGNVYKGSFTNAAKRALAMVGPGNEVYLGAADFDPDTDEDAANEQGKAEPKLTPLATVPAERAMSLFERAKEQVDTNAIDANTIKLMLGSLGVPNATSLGTGIAALTPAGADEFEKWLGSAS